MADHSKPTITSTYTSFVSELDARYDDLSVGLDPAVTTATNLPTNSIRWNSATDRWQKYNGSLWNDLSVLFAINISGNSGTVTNGIYTSVAYSNPTWLTSLSGSKITGNISGNSATATKFATARNINGVAFDGTAAISINNPAVATFNSSGTGSTSGITFNGGTATTISYNTIGAPSTTGANASGTWGINVSGYAGSLSTTSWRVVETATDLKFTDSSGNSKLTLDLTDGAAILSTGSLTIPVGTEVQRPAGAAGKIRFNSTLSSYEGHNGTRWASIGGGATGGGSDAIFNLNGQVVTESFSIPSGNNASSIAPITVYSSAVVTIPNGSRWLVL